MMIFALTEKGRRIPLDPEPADSGNIYVEIVDGVTVAHVAGRGEVLPGVAYSTHFGTCPALKATNRQK